MERIVNFNAILFPSDGIFFPSCWSSATLNWRPGAGRPPTVVQLMTRWTLVFSCRWIQTQRYWHLLAVRCHFLVNTPPIPIIPLVCLIPKFIWIMWVITSFFLVRGRPYHSTASFTDCRKSWFKSLEISGKYINKAHFTRLKCANFVLISSLLRRSTVWTESLRIPTSYSTQLCLGMDYHSQSTKRYVIFKVEGFKKNTRGGEMSLLENTAMTPSHRW